MDRTLAIFAVLCVLMLTGCGLGGGQIPPAATPQPQANTAVVEPEEPAATQPPPPTAVPAASPTPEFPAEPSFEALQPGQSMRFGRVVFTLNEAKFNETETVVNYQVEGLAENTSNEGVGNPFIVLPDGQTLQIQEGGGGGGQGFESAQFTFAPLPAGTQAFTLVIPNSWSGSLSSWKIPVKINP